MIFPAPFPELRPGESVEADEVGHFRIPFRESAPNRYCRLFEPSQLPADLDRYCDALTLLGSAMIDDGSRVSEDRPEILVDCGCTYFGQFVAHDLTKDASSVDEAWRKGPEELENLQTPRLDLEALYGGGPETSPVLYEEDQVRLKTGRSEVGGKSFDICVVDKLNRGKPVRGTLAPCSGGPALEGVILFIWELFHKRNFATFDARKHFSARNLNILSPEIDMGGPANDLRNLSREVSSEAVAC